MKRTLKLCAFLLCFMTIAACHDDDNNNPDYPTTYNPKMEGKWHLINVSGGIQGISEDFAYEEIVWDFDTANLKVTVHNTNTDPQKADSFDSGTYDFNITPNTVTPQNCSLNIVVNSINMGCYAFSPNEFTMSQIEADGYMLQFVREPQVIPFDKSAF